MTQTGDGSISKNKMIIRIFTQIIPNIAKRARLL